LEQLGERHDLAEAPDALVELREAITQINTAVASYELAGV
jgi:hypothetical protein